jgi:hypothetical protein
VLRSRSRARRAHQPRRGGGCHRCAGRSVSRAPSSRCARSTSAARRRAPLR